MGNSIRQIVGVVVGVVIGVVIGVGDVDVVGDGDVFEKSST